MSNLSPVSVSSSGRRTCVRSASVGKKLLELSMVDGDGALAGAEEHAGGGSLAASCCVVFDAGQLRDLDPLWVAGRRADDPDPAYTFSFRYMASPILVFGSMPRTASSTRRIGCRLRTTPRALLAQPALVSAVPAVDLLVFLASRQLDLGRIDDDDMIAGVDETACRRACACPAAAWRRGWPPGRAPVPWRR